MSETFEVVATGAAADAVAAHVPGLVDDGFAGRLFAQDATLWGPDAEEESAKRLSWVGLPESSRPLVGAGLRAAHASSTAPASTTSCCAAWAARPWRRR